MVEPWYKNSKIHHGILDLVEHCPKPHEEISEECKSAMADYFSDVPLEFSRHNMDLDTKSTDLWEGL